MQQIAQLLKEKVFPPNDPRLCEEHGKFSKEMHIGPVDEWCCDCPIEKFPYYRNAPPVVHLEPLHETPKLDMNAIENLSNMHPTQQEFATSNTFWVTNKDALFGIPVPKGFTAYYPEAAHFAPIISSCLVEALNEREQKRQSLEKAQ